MAKFANFVWGYFQLQHQLQYRPEKGYNKAKEIMHTKELTN
jgi:hypothetical protein